MSIVAFPLHVGKCLVQVKVDIERRAAQCAERGVHVDLPFLPKPFDPKTLITTNIGNYPASVFLERLRLQLAGARLR